MTHLKGLTTEEAKKLLQEHGVNQIREVKKTSPLRILIRQVRSNYVLYLLFAAALISFFVGKNITAYTILAVIVAVITAGFVQEYRAEKAIESLKHMLMPISRVLRNGKETEISSLEIVPGDIILLRSGERVPADAVILEESEVRLDEAILTGESKEIKKIGTENLNEANDEHKVFMGTFVVSGKCTAKVLHTGMHTKFGSIAGLVSTAEKVLPLQKKINKITGYMVAVALTMSFLTGLVLFLRADLVTAEFITSTLILMIALSVSAFPEGLPVVLIATLASGANKMAKKNAIVNRMSVIESLGETTVICTDKTGTVTTGEMTVRKILLDGDEIEVSGSGFEGKGEFILDGKKIEENKIPQLGELLRCAVLCNDTRIERTGEDDKYSVHGSATEGALLVMSAKQKIFGEDLNYTRVEDLPFTSERKMMSVLAEKGKERTIYAKGAPETIIKNCTHIFLHSKKEELTDKMKENLLKENKDLTSDALRVLAFAYKEGPSSGNIYSENDLVFLGIAGMEDPPRDEAKEAIQICEKAGMKVKLITGDNKHTAVAIANQVGITGRVIEGEELNALSDEELKDAVDEISIFVRVDPEHKLRIVKALKENDEIVAMTGDGVNDAPALKEAHIGIAMGIKGTDVSRSVSDVILKDDNFATIVSAVIEGRTIFNNIRKFVSYQLSCNLAELSILFLGVLLAPVLGWEVPILLAIQILFMNLVTDNLPALTLGFNPTSTDVLTKLKKKKKREILDPQILGVIIGTGLVMCFGTLASYYISFNILGFSTDMSRTTALITLILIEISTAFAFRSFRKQVLTRSPFVNKYLVIASIISLLATIAIVDVPFLGKIFETTSVGFVSWIIAGTIAVFLLVIFDFGKELSRFLKFLPTH
jgi:P-type Ca2+ transporter type 2C